MKQLDSKTCPYHDCKMLKRRSKSGMGRPKMKCKVCEREFNQRSIIGLASDLLLKSCKNAQNRVKSKRKYYQYVRFVFSDYYNFYQFCKVDEVFWNDWIRHTKAFEEAKSDRNLRPTIDRIDEQGHYEPGNIQCLTLEANRKKAGWVRG